MCSGNLKTDMFGEIFLGKVCEWGLLSGLKLRY